MGPNLFLLLLLGLTGQGSVGILPEVLQAPVGGSIVVQCLYRLQDIRAQKVWCRFLPEGCQTLVSSAVDRRAPGHSRIFLTDLGSGLLQVEMIALREDDAGEYGCVVEGPAGSETLHRIALDILPADSGLKEEEEEDELYKVVGLANDAEGSASPLEPSQGDKSMPLIWGAVLLLGLLVAALVLFAVMVKRKAHRLGIGGRSQGSGISHTVPSSVPHTISGSELAANVSSDVTYIRLDSPPSFDNTTYSSLLLEPPPGKTPPSAPSSSPPLPPKIVISSKPVTYATVIFPGGDKAGGAPRKPAQDPSRSQTPPS